MITQTDIGWAAGVVARHQSFSLLGEPFTASDFRITEEDIQAALEEWMAPVGPRPFGTWGAVSLCCAICTEEVKSIYGHKCQIMIACARCGDLHSMTLRRCD